MSDIKGDFSLYLITISMHACSVAQLCPTLCNPTDYSHEWVSEVAQSCPTLCNPVDCSPPGSSIHGILQTRILEWVAISFSRGSSWPRDRTQVSRIAGRHLSWMGMLTKKEQKTWADSEQEVVWKMTSTAERLDELMTSKHNLKPQQLHGKNTLQLSNLF